MAAAFALAINSGNFIFNYAFVALCGARQTLFHEKSRNCKMQLPRQRHRLLRQDDATPCLKGGLQFQSTLYRCMECKTFFRWWSGERQQDEAGGAVADQMPLNFTTPSVKKAKRKIPQDFPLCKYKNISSADYGAVHAEPFKMI